MTLRFRCWRCDLVWSQQPEPNYEQSLPPGWPHPPRLIGMSHMADPCPRCGHLYCAQEDDA